MGRINVTATLTNSVDAGAAQMGLLPASKVRKLDVEFLVDTGAAMLCLPSDMIEKLGLQKRHERNVITANGRVTRAIYSPVQLNIMDREDELRVMELPTDTPPLLGYLPLEALDLYPNPQKQILEGNPKYDGKMVTDLL